MKTPVSARAALKLSGATESIQVMDNAYMNSHVMMVCLGHYVTLVRIRDSTWVCNCTMVYEVTLVQRLT